MNIGRFMLAATLSLSAISFNPSSTSKGDREIGLNTTKDSLANVILLSKLPDEMLVRGAVEDKSKRTATAKHFLNTDGTYTAIIGAGAVHYNEDGEWKTILAHLLPNNTGKYSDRAHAVVHNRQKLFFPDRPGKSIVSILDREVYQDWGRPALVWMDADGNVLSEIDANAGVSGLVNEEAVHFEHIFPSVDAEIRNSVSSKKLNYVLQNASVIQQRPEGAVFLAFREQVNAAPGWALTDKETGKVASPSGSSKRIYQALRFSKTDGTPMVDLERPIYFDRLADGDCAGTADTLKLNADSHIVGDFAVETLGNNIYQVYTRVPVEWLAAEWRRFPLTIDPTTNYFPPAASGSVWPTYTANRSGNSGNWVCFAGLFAGRTNVFDISYGWVDDSWPVSNPYMDGYATFDITGVPDNAFINSATNFWYRYGGRTCGDAIRLKHGMVQNNENLSIQADCNVDGNRVRNNNAYYNGTGKNATGWQNQVASVANVTSALAGNRITMGWAYNGGDDCCTFVCGGNDGAYHHVYGYQHSTLKPYIQINYCVRPTITAHPADRNICTTAAMTAISVTANGTALTYQWQVSNNTSCTGASTGKT